MIYTVTFNPAIDYVVRTDGPFVPGQVNRSAQEDYQFGGKGINVSLMLARLDCPSVALGFVAGATGSWLEQGLQAQGLHSDWIHLPGGMTRINVKIKAQTESELNGRGPGHHDPRRWSSCMPSWMPCGRETSWCWPAACRAACPPTLTAAFWTGWRAGASRRPWTRPGKRWRRCCRHGRS